MRIGIMGQGRLGSAIVEAASQRDDVDVAWVADRDDEPGTGADVVIDASVADAVAGHLRWAAETATPLVVGATGWDEPRLVEAAARRTGVLVATNFSLTVALLARFAEILGAYTELDPARDPFVVEHHHRAKRDAPSGTARTLADAVAAGAPRFRGWTTATPAADEFPVAVLRAGAEVGHHTVGFDSPAESLELSHRAHSRQTFADGALTAAAWLRGRTGSFTMADVAADILDPLFQNGARS